MLEGGKYLTCKCNINQLAHNYGRSAALVRLSAVQFHHVKEKKGGLLKLGIPQGMDTNIRHTPPHVPANGFNWAVSA
jgi:hypothetical protein